MLCKVWSKQGITHLKHILEENGTFIQHRALTNKFKINTSFIHTLQIQKSIPKNWKIKLEAHPNLQIEQNNHNLIKINNGLIPLQKIQCKNFYWWN